jgi:hypothetical protein
MSNVTPLFADFSAVTARSVDRISDPVDFQSQPRLLTSELRAGRDQLKQELQAFRENESQL